MGMGYLDGVEDQIVGFEVLQKKRSQVVGGLSVFMRKFSRIFPGLGSGKESVSHLLTSQ